jgi:hypothetical protein
MKILPTQVIGDNRPDNGLRGALLAIVNQPITESHQSNSPESWAISLRPSPSAVESRAINLIFWFRKP